jgi:hypothetical protein
MHGPSRRNAQAECTRKATAGVQVWFSMALAVSVGHASDEVVNQLIRDHNNGPNGPVSGRAVDAGGGFPLSLRRRAVANYDILGFVLYCEKGIEMKIFALLLAAVSLIPAAHAQEGSWSQQFLRQATNVYCPQGMNISSCQQFSFSARHPAGDRPINPTYVCESGFGSDSTSCYMGGCGPGLNARHMCVTSSLGWHTKRSSAPAGSVARVTCEPGTKVLSCHSWVGNGETGCGINISADGRTCSTNACGPKTVKAVCAEQEMTYVFGARSASEFVCPVGSTVSACFSMHLPSGMGFHFNDANAETTTNVGGVTTGQNPTACSFDPEFQNYLFCAHN